jgi:hypothetical protein
MQGIDLQINKTELMKNQKQTCIKGFAFFNMSSLTRDLSE